MEKIEMAEQLRQKADVSFEEARTVLEQHDWDLLEAMIGLEKEGKTKVAAAHGSSDREESFGREADSDRANDTAKEKSGADCRQERYESRREKRESSRRRAGSKVKNLIDKGMSNRFVVRRSGEELLSLPVLIAAVLMLVLFWLTVALLVIGLFTHCEYSFSGPDLGKEKINDGIRKATETAQNIADKIKSDINGTEEK